MPIRQRQEDIAQALGVASGSKYAELEPSTASVIAAFLMDYSASPALDIAVFARLALFNYAIGNCDNHLKNYSLLYSPDWSAVRLAPAYDLVSTAHYASFSTEMGMRMRIGATRTLADVTSDASWLFAEQIRVSPNVVRRIAGELESTVLSAFRHAAAYLEMRGFVDAPYLVDELEEDFYPRLEVLRKL